MKMLFVMLYAVLMISCQDIMPENPPIAEVNWVRISDPDLGISIEVPERYSRNDYGERGFSMVFKNNNVIMVNYLSKQEAMENGLWAKHEPVSVMLLGGRNGELFQYKHWHPLSYMNCISYVVNHKDRLLALEFRVNADRLDLVQLHILDSFSFLDPSS